MTQNKDDLEADEGEMTSIMGDEERRLLQRAARDGAAAAVATEAVHLKDTARPPSSGAEPKVVIPRDEEREHAAPVEAARPPTAPAQPVAPSRGVHWLWSLAAFFALSAAAWFAAHQ